MGLVGWSSTVSVEVREAGPVRISEPPVEIPPHVCGGIDMIRAYLGIGLFVAGFLLGAWVF